MGQALGILGRSLGKPFPRGKGAWHFEDLSPAFMPLRKTLVLTVHPTEHPGQISTSHTLCLVREDWDSD